MSEFSTGAGGKVNSIELAKMQRELSRLFAPMRGDVAKLPSSSGGAEPGQFAGWGGSNQAPMDAGRAMQENSVYLEAFKKWIKKAGREIKELGPQQRFRAFMEEGAPGATSVTRNLAVRAADAERGGTQGLLANLVQKAAGQVAGKLVPSPEGFARTVGRGMAIPAALEAYLDPKHGELSITKTIDEERQVQNARQAAGQSYSPFPGAQGAEREPALQAIPTGMQVVIGEPLLSKPPVEYAMGAPIMPPTLAVGEPEIYGRATAGEGFDFGGKGGLEPADLQDITEYLEGLEKKKGR